MSNEKIVAQDIVRGLSEFWKCDDFQDFTVTVGNVHFGCHRLLLAACSDFFKGLFRSGMRETEQKSVVIKDISSETFESMMESMYTGRVVLTDDNVIDIWKGAHQLQIHFLVSECEKFVTSTLCMENYQEYFAIGCTLNSNVVMKSLWTFLSKNCNSFFRTRHFLELPMTDVLTLVKSQDLEPDSEDDVIDAILKWAEFQDNQAKVSRVTQDGSACPCKKDTNKENEAGEVCSHCSKMCTDLSKVDLKLDENVSRDSIDERENQENVAKNDISILLSHARIYLASHRCLQMLGGHPMVRNNEKAKDIVNDALLYHNLHGKGNGHWPSKALHRNNSKFLHCVVTAVKRGSSFLFAAFSMARKRWYPISYTKNLDKIQPVVVNNRLYAIGIDGFQPGIANNQVGSSITGLHIWEVKWARNQETIFPYRPEHLCFAVVDQLAYIFLARDQKVLQLNPCSNYNFKYISLPSRENIAHVTAIDQRILVFYAPVDQGVNQTFVRCYDTSRNTWTELNGFEGSADGMTSFRDDHFTYLLQLNGNLWKVVKPQSSIMDFEFVVKLWSCDLSLHGAVTYLGDLYVFIQPTEGILGVPQAMRSLQGVFREIIYQHITSYEKAVLAMMLLTENDFCNEPFHDSVSI